MFCRLGLAALTSKLVNTFDVSPSGFCTLMCKALETGRRLTFVESSVVERLVPEPVVLSVTRLGFDEGPILMVAPLVKLVPVSVKSVLTC